MGRPMTQPRLIRATEVPEVYGISARQIRRWCAEGRIRRVKLSGPTGPVHFRVEDLDALIEAATLPVGVRAKTSTKRKTARPLEARAQRKGLA